MFGNHLFTARTRARLLSLLAILATLALALGVAPAAYADDWDIIVWLDSDHLYATYWGQVVTFEGTAHHQLGELLEDPVCEPPGNPVAECQSATVVERYCFGDICFVDFEIEFQVYGDGAVSLSFESAESSDTMYVYALVSLNRAPQIAVDYPLVVASEGQTATNSGTVSDLDGDTVALSASLGAVTNNGDGTWSWSYDTTGAPGVQIVTITANDGEGGTAEESFELSVNSAYNAPVVLTVDQDVWYASGGDSVVIVTGTFHDPEGVAPTGPFCGFSSYQCAYDPWSTTCDDANCSSGTWQMGIDLLETVQEVEIMFQDGATLEFSSVWFTTIVVNSAPEIAAGSASVTVDEGQAATNSGTVSDADGDTVALSASLGDVVNNGDGTWSWSIPTSDGPDGQTVTITADDGNGGAAEVSFDLTVNNVAPSVGEVGAPVDPQQVETSVSASASFSDPGAGDTHSAAWDWGDGSTSAGTIDGSAVSGSHVYDTPGVYTVSLTVTDDDGGVGESVFQYVVVYDPTGGFVTGGGWIDSPEGAYAPDPTLTGKASFGFNAKYKKGANVPDGNTNFQFQAGDLHFQSTSYDWLVVAGQDKAKFKGEGTINGAGAYGFMLTATDGSPDTFRIKIWDVATEAVVYDNQMGAADDDYAGTALGGGSIKVHKG